MGLPFGVEPFPREGVGESHGIFLRQRIHPGKFLGGGRIETQRAGLDVRLGGNCGRQRVLRRATGERGDRDQSDDSIGTCLLIRLAKLNNSSGNGL